MNEKYDVTGRVHKLEQRKVWNVGLDLLPNPDSFDVEFSPSGQVLRKTTYNMAGTVISSMHFLYDDAGKTSRSLEFDGAGRQIHSNHFVQCLASWHDERAPVTETYSPGYGWYCHHSGWPANRIH